MFLKRYQWSSDVNLKAFNSSLAIPPKTNQKPNLGWCAASLRSGDLRGLSLKNMQVRRGLKWEADACSKR